MGDTSIETLQGIATLLFANSDITDIVSNRIYTQVPQHTTFPYVRINIGTDIDPTLDEDDFIHRVECQAFSREVGNNQALTIRGLIHDTLNRQEQSITITDAECSRLRTADMDCFIEDDGKTWQGFIAFDVHVSKV